jgi:hypothetical protein
LKKYLKKDKVFSKKWDSLKLIYDNFVSKGDTLNRKKTGKELNNITLGQRVPLLKSYVQNYNNEIVGALIPNFCTLKEILEKEDYLEMFNFLTDKIKRLIMDKVFTVEQNKATTNMGFYASWAGQT